MPLVRNNPLPCPPRYSRNTISLDPLPLPTNPTLIHALSLCAAFSSPTRPACSRGCGLENGITGRRLGGGVLGTLPDITSQRTIQYRVAGPGVHESAPFVVPGGDGRFYVRGKPGSEAWRTTGFVVGSVGTTAFVMGLLTDWFALGCARSSECTDTGAPEA